MIRIYAILATLALDLPIACQKLNSFCDENNVSYDVTVHLGRAVSIINSQSVNIEKHDTKHRADLIRGIHGKTEQI